MYMTTHRQRDIVIEFEKVQLIRRRARTTFRSCPGCGRDAYFVDLGTAARLFETSYDALWHFVAVNSIHRDTVDGYETNICIQSLLEVMQRRKNGGVVKLIEGEISRGS